MAAPVGNQYATNARLWAQAIRRALHKRSKSDQLEALDELAEHLLTLCDERDLGALKELGDRLDGRPSQQIIATDTEGRSLAIGLVAYAAELRPDDPVSIQPKALPTPDIEGTGQRH
jgi:hypothetical protein